MSDSENQIYEHLPPGISLASATDLKEWLMDIRVLDDNPLYKGETYRLKFKFSSNYPIGAFAFSFGNMKREREKKKSG